MHKLLIMQNLEIILKAEPHLEARSGRTAVLFHYAYYRAAAGEHVTFCCRRQSVEFDPPVLPVGVSKGDPALARIHIRQAGPVCRSGT